jgi:hypothetical protein
MQELEVLMNKVGFLLLFVAAVIVPLTAFAADNQTTSVQTATPPTTTESATPPPSDWDRIECKRLPPPTGSRLGGKTVCQTVRQWQRLMQDSQEYVDRMRSRGGLPGATGN